MKSPIDQLEEELWGYCVRQRTPQDQNTVERWQEDEVAHIKERFIVQPVPETMRLLVERAVAQWEEIEKAVFTRLQMNREQFLNEFKKARESFLKGNNEWKKFVLLTGANVPGVVRNMDWVNLFSYLLPIQSNVRHRTFGRMVTSIFYLELLSKHGKNPDMVINNPLGKIEARWRLLT